MDAYGNVTETAFKVGILASQPGDPILPVPPIDPVDTHGPNGETGSWVGILVSNPPGAQFDDYFQMLDQDGTRCGIDTLDQSVRDSLIGYRDSGTLLKVYGTLQESMDAYGKQIAVTRFEEYQP